MKAKFPERPSPEHQQSHGGPTTQPSQLPGQSAFLVQANIHVIAACEFVIYAGTKEAAAKEAQLIADELPLQITAASGSGPDVFVSIPEYSFEVVEVKPLAPDWQFDTDGVQANSVASVGALLINKMEQLERSHPENEGGGERIRAALLRDMSHRLFDEIWRLYAKSRNRQAD